MKIKKIKRKCEVRGCKNTDTYSLTNTNEFGNSVIICEECFKKRRLKLLRNTTHQQRKRRYQYHRHHYFSTVE